ncbi:trigger factor [Caulobacter sp. KR2-114]|uniref:trigger factor n=1 Tax=Caulobacter sp. KR2-114 TaxID=3400912 RepID=UPI003C02775F
MQVVEKSGGGLSRVYGVTVPATELGAKLDAKIAELAPRMNLKGFRPGKVPIAHVKRIYGKDLMREVVGETLNETSQKVLDDNKLRVAAQPDLEPQGDLEQVFSGKEDLNYDLNVEVMPDFEPIDVTTLALTRPVYKPSDAEVTEAVEELAKQNRTYEPRGGKSPKAKDGDQLLIDFVGRIDGEAFDGGTANDANLVLGSGQFIPGFEEQLVGAAPGDTRIVKVSFPETYQVERLAGKPAEFEVTVKEVSEPKEGQADDALAQRLGLGDLDALKAALQSNLEQQYGETSRFKLKRALLDKLDAAHDFPLPPRMVDAEFDVIWQQVEQDRAQGGVAPEDEGKSEDELKAEYRKIAERRVRLGLILAEIGQRNNIQVSEQELNDAMRQEAMRYGAQAQQIYDMLRGNANARNQMRAPIYEEKVVDLILGRAQVTDNEVSKDELLADDELPEGYGEAKADKPAKKAAAKKSPAKKAEADAAPAEEAAAEKPAKAAKAKAEKTEAEAKPAKAAKAKAEKAEPAAEEAKAKPAKKAAKAKE